MNNRKIENGNTIITMPDFGTNTEGTVLIAWSKDLGELIRKGDVLFEVETDKVVCEVEAATDGILEARYFEEGDRIKAGTAVAVLQSIGT